MSCFSGGLVEHLESPPVKIRWEDRRQNEGRNLIVLTSQNKDLTSNPIMKDGEVVNPFTYAVANAAGGAADCFQMEDAKPNKSGPRTASWQPGNSSTTFSHTTRQKCLTELV